MIGLIWGNTAGGVAWSTLRIAGVKIVQVDLKIGRENGTVVFRES